MKKVLLIAILFAGAQLTSSGSLAQRTYVKIRPVAPVILRPTSQKSGYLWVAPEWFWDGDKYVYVNGYWMAPRVAYRYTPGYWKHTRLGEVWVVGAWKR